MIGFVLGLGAVALLGYEAWKRWHAAGPSSPVPPPTPEGTRTDFEHPPRFLASPMRLAPGQRYRFRYNETRFTPESFWGNVHTYASENDLPADWPSETRGALSSSTRFAAGTWKGALGDFDRPDGLLQVWPTLSTE